MAQSRVGEDRPAGVLGLTGAHGGVQMISNHNVDLIGRTVYV